MKKLKLLFLAAALTLFYCGLTLAVDTTSHTVTMQVNEMCAVDLVGGNITLTVISPSTGGDTPSNPTDNTCYLQYTSTVPGAQSRNLTAKWGAADAAPGGCSLKLQATAGGGSEGTGSSQITISSTAQNIITSITNCATGTLPSDGAQLAYTLSVDTFSSLQANENKTATITFTLEDAA